MVEALAAAALIVMHLSRLAEELVLWSSAQFGFIALSDRFSTGSSIMPQKRNPDAAELVRGKTGRVVGALIGLLTTMKGLALTYSKDMQEDKEPLFDAFDSLALCLAAAAGMIRDMTVNADAMARAAGTGHATATDLADWLVQEAGVPFREAHAITSGGWSGSRTIRAAISRTCRLPTCRPSSPASRRPRWRCSTPPRPSRGAPARAAPRPARSRNRLRAPGGVSYRGAPRPARRGPAEGRIA